MNFVALIAVLALSQLVSADHSSVTSTCDGLDHLIDNADIILGQCTRDAECTQVSCISQAFGVPNATITLLPCNVPEPAINIVATTIGGVVVGDFTTSTNEVNQALAFLGTSLGSLDWNVAYDSVIMELEVQINGSITDLGLMGPIFNQTSIPINMSVCAGTTTPPLTTTNIGPTSDSMSCDGLDLLVENVNPILGECTRDAECTQVSCSAPPSNGVPDATITLLPCNVPEPTINIVAIAASGDVLGNYTTLTNEVDQPLTTPQGLTVAHLDWIVTYNSVNMELEIQINGSLLPSLNVKAPLFNETTIVIDTSVCAGSGAPKLQFVLAGLVVSLLVAMLV